MDWYKVAIYIVGGLVSWKGSHYLFLWMEKKGWIYYKTKPSGSGIGNALQELNSFMNPSVKEVLERKFDQKEEDKSEDDAKKYLNKLL